jgi:hypothetical protein
MEQPPLPEDAQPERAAWTLDVDGEVFEVSRGMSGGTHYDWISGRNRDYGFSSSVAVELPEDFHRESIRNFLSMIDPETGYIED